MTTFDVSYRHHDKEQRARQGQIWEKDELIRLKAHFLEGSDLKELCRILQRPAHGIVSKLKQMRLIRGDWTSDDYEVIQPRPKPKTDSDVYKEWADHRIKAPPQVVIDLTHHNPEILNSEFVKREKAFYDALVYSINPEIIIMNDNTCSSLTSPSAPAFETKHFVYGQNISTLSADQLITSIKRIEREIADLRAVKTSSIKITKMIEDLTSMLAKTVEHLDAKA